MDRVVLSVDQLTPEIRDLPAVESLRQTFPEGAADVALVPVEELIGRESAMVGHTVSARHGGEPEFDDRPARLRHRIVGVGDPLPRRRFLIDHGRIGEHRALAVPFPEQIFQDLPLHPAR